MILLPWRKVGVIYQGLSDLPLGQVTHLIVQYKPQGTGVAAHLLPLSPILTMDSLVHMMVVQSAS